MQTSLSYMNFEIDFTSDDVVSAYDELPLWSAMFGQLLLEQVPLERIGAALDIGCGTGFPLIELAERLGPDVEVHGVDPWGAALRRAANKMKVRGVANVTLHERSAVELPFTDESFDLIVSNLGLNNFDDALSVVKECRRVARPGGTLAITTNLQGHMREFYDIFGEVLRAIGKDDDVARLREHIQSRATVRGASDLLESGGFHVRRVVEQSSTMRFRDGTALLNHYFIKLGFLDGWKNVVRSEAPIFEALQARLDERASHHGELSLTVPMAYIEAAATHRG